MSATALYRPGDTFLHRADPRAKLAAILVVLALALTTTRFDVLLILLGLTLVSLWGLAGVTPVSYWKALTAALPLIVLLTLLQGLLQPGPTVSVAGLALSRDGALLGLGIGLRLMVMAVCFYGFSVVTSPTAISLALYKMGLPYKFAYLTSFAFRFLPLMQDEARTLLTAMACRGSSDGTSRNPLRRGRALIRVLFPMLVGALKRSGDTALAMELRGYSQPGPRTFLRPLQLTVRDLVFLLCVLAAGAALTVLQLSTADLLIPSSGG